MSSLRSCSSSVPRRLPALFAGCACLRAGAAATWFVGAPGETPAPPGWITASSLTDALARADGGDTIRLGAGRFSGNWRIETDVQIAGEGAARTVLAPRDPEQPLFGVGVDRSVEIAAVTISGLPRCGAPALVAAGARLGLAGVVIHGWGSLGGTPAVEVAAGNARLAHVTLFGNGIGVRARAPAMAEVENSIIWGNLLDLEGELLLVRDSLLGLAWPGTGNRVADPELADPARGDAHLLPSSPARALARWQRVGAEADGEPRWPARDGSGQWRVDAGADQFVDTDLDGLPNYWEIACGLDPTSEGDAALDPDGDGLTNAAELGARSHPRRADSDGDGLSDGEEAARGTDPDRRDTDRDGLADGDELHMWGTDPRRADSDGDGMPDGFEATQGLTPLAPAAPGADADGDGYSDRTEYEMGTIPIDPWSPPTYHVAAKGDAETAGDGSAARPFRTLAEALAGTQGPAILALAPGEHAAGVALRSGVTLRGRDAASTVLVAGAPGPVLRLHEVRHVRMLGLTLRGGAAERGGGVQAESAAFYLGASRIEGCTARQGGGFALRECGGVVIERVAVVGNRAEQGGGAALERSFAVMDGVAFFDNRAVRGGGIHALHSDAGLRNAWLCGNRAQNGGAFWIEGSMRPLLHLTLADNRATGIGAIGGCSPGPLRIINSIAWGHVAGAGADPAPGIVWDAVLTDLAPRLVGTEIREGAPRFRAPEAYDYHIQPGSSAVDAGRLGVALGRDADGEPRSADGDGDRWVRPDLGADELIPSDEDADRPEQPRPGPKRAAPAEAEGALVPAIVDVALDEGRLALEWLGRPGAVYEVQACGGLGVWERVGALVILDDDARARWVDPRWADLAAAPPAGFYRVRELRMESGAAGAE